MKILLNDKCNVDLIDETDKYYFIIGLLDLKKVLIIRIGDYSLNTDIHRHDVYTTDSWEYIRDILRKDPINYIIGKLLSVGNKKKIPRLTYIDKNKRIKIDYNKLYIDGNHIR
jgi:hypothetical protein